MDYSEFSQINEAIYILIKIKNKFRETAPTFTMDETQRQIIRDDLIKLNNKLAKLNEKFDIKYSLEQNEGANFKESIKNKLFVVNSSKNRKKLIDLGFDPDQILATGGPITVMDIKTLNPQITNLALQNFQNKIQTFWTILKSKVQGKIINEIILLLEKENVADKILSTRKEEFEKNLSLPIQIIVISTFDQLNNQILSQLSDQILLK